MRIYGLTGGTGSGKSEVAKRFAERGIPVIDADAVGHEVIEPGGAAAEAVVQAFGERILTSSHIDREKLGQVVFADPKAIQRLNAIVHPAIYRVIAERCAALAQAGHDCVVIDAALLAEQGKRDAWLDGLILVTASRETRCARLVQSRNLDPAEARRRIDAQTDPDRKIPLADWIIENEGALEALRAHGDRVAAALRAPHA